MSSFLDEIGDIEPIPFELVFEHDGRHRHHHDNHDDSSDDDDDDVTACMISQWCSDVAADIDNDMMMNDNNSKPHRSSASTCTTTAASSSWGSTNIYLMIGEQRLWAIVDDSLRRVVQDIYLEFFLRGFYMNALRKQLFNVLQTTLLICQESDDGSIDFDEDENAEFERFFNQIQATMVDDHQRLFNLGLKEGHFDLVLGHVVLAMENCGLDRTMISRIVPLMARFRQIFEEGALEAKNKHFHACQSLRC